MGEDGERLLEDRCDAAPARATLLACSALAAFTLAALAADAPPAPRLAIGTILYAARPTMVRTRGSGNLAVDLPRGRALLVRAIRGGTVILAPSPSDADLLRQYGVRKIPSYGVPRRQIEADFIDAAAWTRTREEDLRLILERWPALAPEQAERVLSGEVWPGMSREQAERAVGDLVFSREERESERGREETWRVGRRPRAAELRQFNEGREKGVTARTFEEYLALKTRTVLRFRDGVLRAVEAPEPPRPGTP